MLDTIALTLKQDVFEVLNMDAFSPSARGIYLPPYYTLGGRGYIDCRQNPSKTDMEQGIYKPRLTLTKRKGRAGYDHAMRVEFSAPKLLLGNNFDELTDADFGNILGTLHQKISSMGIRVARGSLEQASVSAIHYSKNVKLPDYATCTMVLTELGHADLTRRLDSNKTDYRNEGSAIRAHASSYEIVFYDKMQDMRQAQANGERRAIEKDYAIQRELFGSTGIPGQLEVLRMEVRLGNRTKLKSVLETLGIHAGLTFAELFRADISRTVLLHYWRKATDDMPLLALSRFAPEDIYEAMAADSQGTAKPAKLLQRLGAFALAQSVGLRGAKALITHHADARTWQRIKKDLNGLDALASMKYAATQDVQRCLEAFSPLRMTEIVGNKKGRARI